MTFRRSLFVFFLIAAALLSSCASTPPAEPQPTVAAAPASSSSTMSRSTAVTDPKMATVYIYRPKSFVGMALQPTVLLDGQDLIDVRNGTMWMGKFKPGHYNIQMDDKKSGGEMDLKAGQNYYMRVDITTGVFKGGGRMTQVTADQAVKDMEKLSPLPASEVKHPMFQGM